MQGQRNTCSHVGRTDRWKKSPLYAGSSGAIPQASTEVLNTCGEECYWAGSSAAGSASSATSSVGLGRLVLLAHGADLGFRFDFSLFCLSDDLGDLRLGLLVRLLRRGGVFLGRLGLGCRSRLELLFRRQLAALGHDQRPHLGADVLEDVDRDLVAADPFDRLRQVDLPPIDADLLRAPELVGDVRGGDRSEQGAGRTRLDVEAKLGILEHGRDLARLVDRARLVAGTLLVAPFHLGNARGRRCLGELARQQVVAGEAARDRDDVAAEADLVDVLQEDDLRRHQRSPT